MALSDFAITHIPLPNMSSTTSTEIGPPCPYVHIAALPTPPLMSPSLEHINCTEESHRAMFASTVPSPYTNSVSAIADSGASHVLFRLSDAHILSNTEFSSSTPYAALTAANHATITAIGRGTLTVQNLTLTAYIFRDSDLANNLLGLIPFSNLGCTSIFRPKTFQIFRENQRIPILTGKRVDTADLWNVILLPATASESDGILPPNQEPGIYVEASALSLQDTASYVKFSHASLGYPAPSTLYNAVKAGFITGPNQYPRLTTKMVRRHWPNELATARGHLDRHRSAPPHEHLDAVSARRRHHTMATRRTKQSGSGHIDGTIPAPPFSLDNVPRSTTLHLDYTGPLPEACTSGTRYLQVSCYGGYINIIPLRSLRAEHTAPALKQTVDFFRDHNITLDALRIDNQTSPPFLQMVKDLKLSLGFVPPYVKNPNRAERAIRTAKNHIISTRAGFHHDCPHNHLDRCLVQIEMTVNIVRPFEYDTSILAYEGIHGATYDFQRHPIAPVGCKVLTWDAPDHRGSWADHGVPGVYLGPALDHLRSFEVWVPNTSAPRITNTVWWFLADHTPDLTLTAPDPTLAYPPTKTRPHPLADGTDLIGRTFFEPDLGVCLIVGTGPVTQHRMASRAA
jgi:hypothetical protein